MKWMWFNLIYKICDYKNWTVKKYWYTFNNNKVLIKLIGYHKTEIRIRLFNVCTVEPDIGVDHNDITRVHSGGHVTMTLPPTLGWWPQCPGLDTLYLSLPWGHVNIVNVNMSSRSLLANKYPWFPGRCGVRTDEGWSVVQVVEHVSHWFMANCPTNIPGPGHHLLIWHPEHWSQGLQMFAFIFVVPALFVFIFQNFWVTGFSWWTMTI